MKQYDGKGTFNGKALIKFSRIETTCLNKRFEESMSPKIIHTKIMQNKNYSDLSNVISFN